ncbi:glycosyltransferase family 25 protein [Mollisia scopiformis]|uniref:Glycosyltransferase family 25 protein n=1 Tax=Mollisia scopiformis TaxID=149040 RepID=A0A194X3N9_MOLSC|nr:glycosyltransferase family 25 protein [Mollisia scopiformis]KUJ14781.1 glycosyltransferase family 25 protein [Mollisia scopiformis]
MLQPRSFPFSAAVFFGLVILLLLYTPRSNILRDYSAHILHSYSKMEMTHHVEDVSNSTLGFQKIFAVGLPERSDKRDALALISSLTGFKVDWVDGVKGESIPDKALPYGVDRVQLWENNLGSWRGHLNAVRNIVEQGITTALIVEDDVDWDVRLMSQLQIIAHGTQALQGLHTPLDDQDIILDSPYGNNWDLLWLGHCGEVFPENLPENFSKQPGDPISRKFVVHADPTVPPPQHTHGFQNFTAEPHTRWVHVTGGPICTFAYALSLSGARKVLYDLSVDHLVGPFDNALAGLCRWGRDEERLDMKCLSVTPPVFVHHKAKGRVQADSDIQGYGGDGEVRSEGYTENVVWSARDNIRELMLGKDMKSQFRDTEVV